MTSNRTTTNRVDAALNRWRTQENRYVQQYGKDVYRDRDFMKVRAYAYKAISDEFKNKKLGFEEKLDLRVLRGQMKQMNERIYPNRYLRAAVGMLKLLSRPLQAAGKFTINILSLLITGQPYFVNKKTTSRGKQVEQTQTLRGEVNRPSSSQQTNSQNHTQQMETLKRIPRERVLTAEQNGQSLHP